MEQAQTIRFHAEMTCQGCANAITRILKKVEGVGDVACDVPGQTVTVQASSAVSSQDLLTRLKTWGDAANKQVSLA